MVYIWFKMSNEKEKLQRELEYLSKLIEAHKTTEHITGYDMPLTQNTHWNTVVKPKTPLSFQQCLSVESVAQPLSLNTTNVMQNQTSLTECMEAVCVTSDLADNKVDELSDIESANCDLSMTKNDSILYCDDGSPDITCVLASNMKALYNATIAKPGIAHVRTFTSHSSICPTNRSKVDTKPQFVNTLTVPCEDTSHGERTITDPYKFDNSSLVLGNKRRIVLTSGDHDQPFSESLLVTTINNKAISAVVGGRKVVTASQPIHLPSTLSGLPPQPSLLVQFSTLPKLPCDTDDISSRLAKCQSLTVKSVATHMQPNKNIDRKRNDWKVGQVFTSNRYKLVRMNAMVATQCTQTMNSSSGLPSVAQSTRGKQQHLSSSSDINVNKYKLIRKPNSCDNATNISPALTGSGEIEVPKLCQKDQERVSDECTTVHGSFPVSKLTSVALSLNRYKLIRKRNKSLSQSFLVVASKKLKTSRSEMADVAAETSSATTKSSPLAPISKYKLVRKQSSSNCRPSGVQMTGTLSKKCGPVQRESSMLSLVNSSCGRQRLISKAASFSSKYALAHSAHDVVNQFDMNQVLGRRVANLSRSKYKFVNAHNSSTSCRSTTSLRNKLQKSLLKFDRRSSTDKNVSRICSWHQTNGAVKWPRRRATFYSITRQIYTATRDEKGKLSGSPSVISPWRTSITTRVAQRLVSQMRWSAAEQHRKTTTSRSYCIYFNRFGRCSRGDKCKYIHDPEKVSVCTRYLRGTCKVTDCPFSHRVTPDKMPTCLYFMRGVCSRSDCPYRHVRVAVNAQPCLDFARGYCQLGDMCKKDHVLICPDFIKSGGVACPRGKRCPLKHVRHKVIDKSTTTTTTTTTTTVGARKLIQDETLNGNSVNDDDVNLPMKQRHLPSFIALNTSDNASMIATPTQDRVVCEHVPLLLRPRLAPPSNCSTNLSSWLRDSLD